MKLMNVVSLTDAGDMYKLNYLTTSREIFFERQKDFHQISSRAASTIKRYLNVGKIVFINKEYNTIIQEHDITVQENKDLEIETIQAQYLIKARQMVTHEQANVSGILMFEYYNLNNFFNSKGFFICTDNKEEMYLKILETEDDDLINRLEQLLNAMDQIHRASSLEYRYLSLYEEISNTTSEKEIKKIFFDFTSTTFQEFVTEDTDVVPDDYRDMPDMDNARFMKVD